MATDTTRTIVINGDWYHDVPIEYHDGGVDWTRVIVECRNAGIRPTAATGYTRTVHAVEVTVDGIPVVSIPLWKVLSYDPERLHRWACIALDKFPVGLADQIVAAINDGDMTIDDDPTGEWVTVDSLGYRICNVHRRLLVADWPDAPPQVREWRPREP